MKYEEVEKHLGCPIYLESFCSNRWIILKALGTIVEISPYVAIFVPSRIIVCMNSCYRDLPHLYMPTINIDKIESILAPEDMYSDLIVNRR